MIGISARNEALFAMMASLRVLLTGIIDYAGMFPPAQLPMDQAIHNYARYRKESDSWMLGKFICPASKLKELSQYLNELFRDGPPLAISALGRGERDDASFLIGLKQDLMDIDSFCGRHDSRVEIKVLETKIPTTNANTVAAARLVLDASRRTDLQVFYEHPGAGSLMKIAGVDRRVGHKIRCGGLTSDAFPSAESLANVIACGIEAKVPLKFTAGLHHPFRRFDKSVNTKMFGFLNVFGAGTLSATANPPTAVIQQILEDEASANFRFSNDGMAWRDFRATIAQIEAARRNSVISFGSCSFEEPREDLRALGWM